MTKPLLISDCDEVLLAFAMPFADHLDEVHGLSLSFESFALSGNIRRKADGVAIADEHIRPLLDDFFENGMGRQTPVPGAVAALETLSAHYDIIILTNIDDRFRAARRAQIGALGMPYEVYCNSGPKGPALARLVAEHGDPAAVFIDDLPPHHGSAKAVVPEVHRLHMIADTRLAGLIPPAPDAHARIDDWGAATRYLIDHADTARGPRHAEG
ncbi:MAG: HAD family hydrolase [Pseudomonadota bacterium]